MSATAPKPQALPGRLLAGVMLLVVALVVVGAWRALSAKPEAGAITAAVAIDAEYAVFVRQVVDDPERMFVSLMHLSRGEDWGALVPARDMRIDATGRIAAEAGVVSARTATGGVPYVQAFEALHGVKLGRHRLTLEAVPGQVVPTVGSLFGDGIGVEFSATEAGFEVIAIELKPGKTRWLRQLGAEPVEAAWLRPGRLVIYRPGSGQGPGRVQIVDTATGDPVGSDIAVLGRPCVVAERIYAISDTGSGIAIELGAGNQRPVAALDGLVIAGPGRTGGRGCGQYRERDVLLVSAGANAPADSDFAAAAGLIWLDRASLAERARLALPAVPAEVADGAIGIRDRSMVGPALTRFVPLLLGPAGPDSPGPTLAMIDLEQARIAHESAASAALAGARVLASTGVSYLWSPAGPTLAVFRGDTGQLAAAVEIAALAPLRAAHMADDRVWVWRDQAPEQGDSGHSDSGQADAGRGAPWAVLSGADLVPVAAGRGSQALGAGATDSGIVVTDVTRPFAAKLSMP